MNKARPALICFAALNVAALYILPRYGPTFFLADWALLALASLACGVYALTQRRWFGMFFVASGVAEIAMLSPAFYHK